MSLGECATKKEKKIWRDQVRTTTKQFITNTVIKEGKQKTDTRKGES